MNEKKEMDKIWKKAHHLHFNGKYKEAIKNYDLYLKSNPNHVRTLVNKGEALNRMGLYKRALIYHNKALNRDPKNINALLHKGTALLHLKRYEEARKCYDYSIKIAPFYYQAFCNIGNIFYAQCKFKIAIRWYNKSLELKPKDVATLANKAWALRELNLFKEANECIKKILSIPIEGQYYPFKELVKLIKDEQRSKKGII